MFNQKSVDVPKLLESFTDMLMWYLPVIVEFIVKFIIPLVMLNVVALKKLFPDKKLYVKLYVPLASVLLSSGSVGRPPNFESRDV